MIQKESKIKWYQTVWGILLISLFIILFSLLVGFIFLVLDFREKIENGEGQILLERINRLSGEKQTQQKNISEIRSVIEDIDEPYLGNQQAEIVIVEFIDFSCPYCKESFTTIHKINSVYGDEVKIIIKDYPVESLHPGTNELSVLANCAFEQDKFWEMHNLLFVEQDNIVNNIKKEKMLELGKEVGLDMEKLENCLEDPDIGLEVNQDFSEGVRYGVRGTPTFFVNGQMVEGVIPWENWEKFLNTLLK